ncbi:UDP-glucose:Glyco protein glucosyltransferase-domain-containing protein [Crucibulum laeve]|uniref:UDP-glucose:Glyco protein glucosyltransferase-domain-containing protein n=1 Tax=Crucibulum laeve TaxID=68775 RepID=A0A5C3LZ46_9AGAR|nr:UDP-glucose:Glyco protein glucosyltransferase-domain-containing protein [Crucibulum laeve]
MKYALSRALGIALAVLASKAASPPVKVSLRSSWSAPPLLPEILETVALEHPDAFFTYLDRLTDPETLTLPGKLSPEAIHLAALEVAVSNGLLQAPGSLTAVEMNLALHAATPKLEAFYQHYEDHHNNSAGTKCGSWVDWYGEVVCDVDTLAKLAGVETIDPAEKLLSDSSYTRPTILTFDHIFPPQDHILERPPRTAVLYGSLDSPNFRGLHTYLLSLANRPDPHVEYVFRHVPPTTREDKRNYLSGYGVSLDLKKMDYLALDDRYAHKSKDEAEISNNETEEIFDPILSLIHAHPENTSAPDAKTPLTSDELTVIGQQASQLIADSENPLTILTLLSQNFPKYASALARRVVVNESVITELHANSLRAQGGINMFWLNGASIDVKDAGNPFTLLRMLKKERSVMQSMTGLGLERTQAFEILTHPSIAASQKDKGMLDGLFDASDRPEEGGVVAWWNDIEKDGRYAKWSPSIYSLIRIYPGQLPSVKLNLFNVILVLDLSQSTSITFLAGPMASIIDRSIPFRFGVVPIAETEESKKMAKLFYYLRQTYGRKKTMTFIKQLREIVPETSATVPWSAVRSAYDDLFELEESSETPPASLDDIVNGNIPAAPLGKVAAYTERLGATLAASPFGHAFFNGKHFDMGDDFLRQLQMELGQQLQYFQEKVYSGEIKEDSATDMENYFYNMPTTAKRRTRYIYPSTGGGSLRIMNLPELFEKTGLRLSPSSYIYPADTESVPMSVYVVADLDSEVGLELVKEALGSITKDSRTRLSFIHNPTDPAVSDRGKPASSRLFGHLMSTHTLSNASPNILLSALGLNPLTLTGDSAQAPITQEEALNQVTGGVESNAFSMEAYADYTKSSRLVVRDLHLTPGQLALVINGRVVGPIDVGEFHSADFRALEEYELRKRTEPIVAALKSVVPDVVDGDRASFANLVAMTSSIIASTQQPDPSEIGLFDAPQRPRQRNYQLLDSKYTAFEFGSNATALYHIAVLVDPLSETAQKWSSILRWLANVPDVFIQVYLNPARYADVPLKRFYRYNILPSLTFDNSGYEVPAQAVFENLPIDPIYTLAMDVPSPWLVRPREALYDLDNVQLGHLSPGDTSVDAVFDLDYIVVEGHAREIDTNGAPRGVQLELVASDGTSIDDTQVVANLGYLQFKAKPGVFKLEIREGRGRKIFKMDSVGNEGWESPTVEEVGSDITVTSFEGLTLYPRFSRLPDMEAADVLQEDDSPPGGFFEELGSKLMSMFKHKKEEAKTALTPAKQQAEINIFTVASGLLYERFVSIMILSVLRNTNSTVKFWFIENFLSPSFLEFIPHLAEKYNFQYELVTYKWPSWLRAQTEKQRIIWAYKILFLDVLFPMDLKKVIFVDADQIVRADLKELVDLDLRGAPYGYTPMGDDNYDMEGFRFWKTGYWKDFLQGRPYHISALYVIDLVKFRQMAAGDILRGQYQALSADPNSLANLDQDLPNNLQKEVPIFSLGEDWLWCETWCSKDRLHRAKTIDLCQNPLTKEPKLARARQIPEWEEYDAEIARFARQLVEEGKIHSRMATADANVLAGGNGAVAETESSTPELTEEVVEVTEEEDVPGRDEL